MNREWSEEGLNFEAEISVAELKNFGVQKNVVKEEDEEDEDE